MTDYTEAPLPQRRSIGFQAPSHRSRAQEHAQRHTRRVRFLKIALPCLAAAGLLAFYITSQFSGDPGAPVSLAGVNADQKTLVMKAPHISGFDGTKKSYDITAANAVQELDNPKVATLTSIIAHFGMGGGDMATVNAKTGVYDSDKNGLVLPLGLVLETTNGYHAELQDAQIDMTGGHLISQKPVKVRAADGTIDAHSIEIINKGERVIFGNGVTVMYYPPPKKPASGSDDGTQPATAAPATTGAVQPANALAPVATAGGPAPGTAPATAAPAKADASAAPAKPPKPAKAKPSGQ